MKFKFFVLSFLTIIFINFSFAYEPSTGDYEDLTELKNTINILIENDNQSMRSFYQQARDLLPYFSDEKTSYYLQHLRDYLLTKIQTRKAKAKIEGRQLKNTFLELYQGSGLVNAKPLTEKCYGWYQTLDNMSFSYDFPTALTIAIWYRETNCGYYLPKNGNGPFQIVKKEYGDGPIDRKIFELTIRDFLEFSKRKIERYNSKNPETPIELTYVKFNYQDLYKFAGLYNGLSGSTVYGDIGPAAPKYFFERMPGKYENGKRNGLFLHFLRVLEWELNQI